MPQQLEQKHFIADPNLKNSAAFLTESFLWVDE